MQVSDAIAQIELAEEEVVSSGLSIAVSYTHLTLPTILRV